MKHRECVNVNGPDALKGTGEYLEARPIAGAEVSRHIECVGFYHFDEAAGVKAVTYVPWHQAGAWFRTHTDQTVASLITVDQNGYDRHIVSAAMALDVAPEGAGPLGFVVVTTGGHRMLRVRLLTGNEDVDLAYRVVEYRRKPNAIIAYLKDGIEAAMAGEAPTAWDAFKTIKARRAAAAKAAEAATAEA